MGLLQKLLNISDGSQLSAVDGYHSISKENVFQATPGGINPENVRFTTVEKATPHPDRPKYFKKTEADAIKIMADTKEEQLKWSEEAYKDLGRAIAADGKLHTIHRNSQMKAADVELQRQIDNNRLSKHMLNQVPKYHALGQDHQRDVAATKERLRQTVAAYG